MQDGTAHRSAVDRAYYAAFLTARDTLAQKGYGNFPAGSQAHLSVVGVLRPISHDAARRLTVLRRARNRLTYQPGRQTLPRGQSLAELLDSARVVIEAVQALPAKP